MEINDRQLTDTLLTALTISKSELIRELEKVDVEDDIQMEKVIELMQLYLDVYDTYTGAKERFEAN